MNIELNNGKYTVRTKPDGALEALRYGDEWRDLTGDDLVFRMAHEIINLRAELKYLESRKVYSPRWGSGLNEHPLMMKEAYRLDLLPMNHKFYDSDDLQGWCPDPSYSRNPKKTSFIKKLFKKWIPGEKDDDKR